jgi:hypothetical protein
MSVQIWLEANLWVYFKICMIKSLAPLLLSNGPELALHRHDRELKKTYINFIPCSARTISSVWQIIIFFGAISIHCGGRHPVSVMMNTLFLKCISCCCLIDGMQFWTPILFYIHKTVLVSPWLCCIDKWHTESL